jgi:nuclear protein localization family protein 4
MMLAFVQVCLNIVDCSLCLQMGNYLPQTRAEAFTDMSENDAPLESIGVAHGDIIHMFYNFERRVEGAKLPEFMKRSFGAHMTIEEMVAKQTRIERQDVAVCSSASFDMHAANMFQSYIQSAMAFSIKRGGILYGEIDEDKNVLIHAIYEPPQQGSQDGLVLERNTSQEQLADRIASIWGWKKVGWVFSQSTKERDFIFSAEEVLQMAAIQSELGECSVTGVVALSEPEQGDVPEIHFEAFQVSKQCVEMYEQGWFAKGNEIDDSEPPKSILHVVNPQDIKDKSPVIVAGKDVNEIDVDYFLVPVGIKDHESVVMNSFAIENRLLPQGPAELKSHLNMHAGKRFTERLKDFHLMLYLAENAGFTAQDMDAIAHAVMDGCEEVPEGYVMIINGMAGI